MENYCALYDMQFFCTMLCCQRTCGNYCRVNSMPYLLRWYQLKMVFDGWTVLVTVRTNSYFAYLNFFVDVIFFFHLVSHASAVGARLNVLTNWYVFGSVLVVGVFFFARSVCAFCFPCFGRFCLAVFVDWFPNLVMCAKPYI